jgi:hypothetical protein
MIEQQDVFRGLFVALTPMSMIVAAIFWYRIVWPAIVAGNAIAHTLGLGKALIATGLSVECIVYGAVRWMPDHFLWLGAQWPIVGGAKTLYIMGMVFVIASLVPEEVRKRRLLVLACLSIGAWAAGTLLSYRYF